MGNGRYGEQAPRSLIHGAPKRRSACDTLIVAAALASRCELLITEDPQLGRSFDNGLCIENPFRT